MAKINNVYKNLKSHVHVDNHFQLNFWISCTFVAFILSSYMITHIIKRDLIIMFVRIESNKVVTDKRRNTMRRM